LGDLFLDTIYSRHIQFFVAVRIHEVGYVIVITGKSGNGLLGEIEFLSEVFCELLSVLPVSRQGRSVCQVLHQLHRQLSRQVT
jgi:hypothetical protein